MGVSAKELLNKTKERWQQQSKKRKIGIVSIIAAVLLIALGVTLILNSNQSGYVVLYSNLDSSEASQIYSAVQDLGVSPQMNSRGEIEVPKEEYDRVLLQLAAQGYPESAMPYDVFFDHSSITATESDKQTALLFQLQDRLQTTLQSIDAVSSAKVTLTLAEDSNYVWQQATSENNSTASVLLTLKPRETLAPEQVSAIKNLVAFATPKLTPENVKVIDSTGVELAGLEEESEFSSAATALECEQAYQNMLEENAKKLLVPRYGADGVVASARVTLDFDKMMQERKEILQQEDGTQTPTHTEHEATVNGTQAVGGLVGEQNNTDIPAYGQTDPTEDGGSTYYRDSVDYDYGYVLEQIESGKAPEVLWSSITVYVDDGQVQNNQYDLVEQISNATGIAQENISVASLNPGAIEDPVEEPTLSFFEQNRTIIIGGAVILGVILIIIAVVILLLRRRAKRLEEEREAELASQALEEEVELEEYKQKLEDAARSKGESKERVITDEVRNFAKENPEITASLLRSWLKESE